MFLIFLKLNSSLASNSFFKRHFFRISFNLRVFFHAKKASLMYLEYFENSQSSAAFRVIFFNENEAFLRFMEKKFPFWRKKNSIWWGNFRVHWNVNREGSKFICNSSSLISNFWFCWRRRLIACGRIFDYIFGWWVFYESNRGIFLF